MSLLGERLLAVHDSLTAAGLPHAFGGAIALAYCTEEPRGTRDLDVNVFLAPTRARDALSALPGEVVVGDADVAAAQRDGQVRVWWQDTPLDVFLDVHSFHGEVAQDIRSVPFQGRTIPVLDCTALAVFKALFDRTKDWADIEGMLAAGALEAPRAIEWLERIGGADSAVAARLSSLAR